MKKQQNNKKQKKKQQHNRKKFKFSYIVPWIIPMGLAIYMVQITIDRIRIKSDPIETIAYISKKKHIGGRSKTTRIYYYFRVNDTLVYGTSGLGEDMAEILDIHDRILVHYERKNPNNNIYYDTVPMNYFSK